VALAGRPMIEWSIAAFRSARPVGSILIATPPGHLHDLTGDDLGLVAGGKTRAESVANALAAVDTELVAIHDAARPLVTPGLIEDLIAALLADPGAAGVIAAAPLTDTIKQVGPSASGPGARVSGPPAGELVIERTLDRSRLWAAQTPQVFRTDALRAALAPDLRHSAAATDEASLVEAAGGRVLIHPAPAENLKVTTPLDLRLAAVLLAKAG